jgi:hypothetical protein
MADIIVVQKRVLFTDDEKRERQKIATQKYRELNRAKIYETSKRYKKERVERDPEYLLLLYSQTSECNRRRKEERLRGEETPKRSYIRIAPSI